MPSSPHRPPHQPKTALRLLLIEDTEDDSLLILAALRRAGYEVESLRVETESAMREALQSATWDLIISDYCMPEFDAPGAIAVQQKDAPDIPLIVVSGTVGEDVAVEALKLGADDYLLKQNLTRLVPAVERSLQVAEGRRERRALENLKNLFMDKLLDIVCTIDTAGCFCQVSASAETILGYRKEELVGRAFIDFVHPDDIESSKSEAGAVMRGCETKDFENRYIHKSGKFVNLMWSAVWSPDDQMLIAVARDVSDRKRKEEELRLRERALGEVSQGVLIADENRLTIFSNASFSQLTGYEVKEILGRNCSFLQGPETDPTTILNMRAALDAKQPFEGEIMNYRKDGTPFWNELSIAPIPGENGEPIRFVGIQRDVTERRQMEEALRGETAFFGGFVESSLDGILVVNNEGRKILQNNRLNKLWNISPDVAASNNDDLQAMFASEQTKDPAEFSAKVAHLVAHPDEISRDEIALLNGTILDRYSAPVRDKEGRYYGRIWKFRDVTENRLREKKLNEALSHEKELSEKARAGERAKSEFLAVMSHEVRTPLNGILGFADLLACAPSLIPEHKNYARIIVQSGEALLRILDDILDFSRLEAGRLVVENTQFSPREILEGIRTLLSHQAAEKHLSLHVDVADDIPDALKGDAGRLRQVLLNLAGNALKFTEQGSVIIRLETEPGSRSAYVFSVKDTGVGIAPEKIDSIFDPFTQADSSISRRFGGAGLGLTICQRLTELMGGKLTVTSRLGQGSDFVVSVPLNRVAPARATAPEPPSDLPDVDFAQKYPLRVLLVEDDRINLKLIQAFIRKLGYDPLAAHNGREAVELFRTERPDFILMDLQMPVMDGIEATQNIRALEKLAGNEDRVFISALTANIFEEDRQRCFDAGMDEYLNKPVKFSALADMIVKASHVKATAGLQAR